ncbi:MAG: hypothetical protein RL077_1013 [Verrucomicrobiota bacterium]|jgi:CubicO group peptidase (beta-lactamase class C family)
MKFAFACAFFAITVAHVSAEVPAPARQRYATPSFRENARRAQLESVRSEIDHVFREAAAQKNYPGLVWGLVLDGDLVHTGAIGWANVAEKIPATRETRFRIASMTKSFTALAIIKLRDAGHLSLADPIAKFLPEFRHITPLTADAPAITVRHLLTMTPGFPEDNPWGDRQLAVSPRDFADFLTRGLALANPPGVTYEYSNLAFALLGQIITHVSGQPYQRYLTREILEPLGLRATRWEYTEVPPDQLALGYRWEDGAWLAEPLLHDGVYGAMGGLLTTIDDFARYVNFHLEAWPPRDDPDDGIVHRASLREMHRPSEFTGLNATAKNRRGEIAPTVSAYGYGLSWQSDEQGIVRVGHGGGLPGFGSYYQFFPDYGFGVISFANLTYAGTRAATVLAGDLILEIAKITRRHLPASTILQARQTQVADLLRTWDPTLAATLVAENFFLDRSLASWRRLTEAILTQAGPITEIGEITAQNQLRGTFPLIGPHGRITVAFTLTPEKNPRVQALKLTFTAKP